jgi:hypothetical protein
MPWAALPVGTFVLDAQGAPLLVLENRLVPWTMSGYSAVASPRPSSGTAEVLTPPSSVAALAAGYVPQVDAGAFAASL